MFKKYTLLFTFLFTLYSFGQVTDLITNLSYPRGTVIHNNKLYVAESSTGKVLEYDLSNGNTLDFATSLAVPIAMIKLNNELLIAENDNFRIAGISLNQSTSTTTNFLTIQDNQPIEPWGLAISEDGNNLFVSETQGRIFKVDLTQTPLNPQLFWNNTNGTSIDLAIEGNDLYVSESENENNSGGRILKLDTTQINPVAEEIVIGIDFPIGLEIIGNNLFYTSWTNFNDGNDTISRIDLTQTNPQPEVVLDNLVDPAYLTYDNGTLYISQLDRVSSIPSALLSISENIRNERSLLYPNPTNEFLNVSAFEGSWFKIFNSLGQQLEKGLVTFDKLDVSDFPKGIYYFQTEGKTSPFIVN
ncbi:MAG: T9SS type A sorting domain-containing protein [Nonlabens sp.]